MTREHYIAVGLIRPRLSVEELAARGYRDAATAKYYDPRPEDRA